MSIDDHTRKIILVNILISYLVLKINYTYELGTCSNNLILQYLFFFMYKFYYLLFSPTSCIGTKTKSTTPYDVSSNARKSSV